MDKKYIDIAIHVKKGNFDYVYNVIAQGMLTLDDEVNFTDENDMAQLNVQINLVRDDAKNG